MIVQAFLHNTSSALAWGSEAEFVEEVFRFYENSSSHYRLDLAYSGDRDRILASRFLIQVGHSPEFKCVEDMGMDGSLFDLIVNFGTYINA